jgi:hypothetical protein
VFASSVSMLFRNINDDLVVNVADDLGALII